MSATNEELEQQLESARSTIRRIMAKQEQSFRRLRRQEERRRLALQTGEAGKVEHWTNGFMHDAYQSLTNIATQVLGYQKEWPSEFWDGDQKCYCCKAAPCSTGACRCDGL